MLVVATQTKLGSVQSWQVVESSSFSNAVAVAASTSNSTGELGQIKNEAEVDKKQEAKEKLVVCSLCKHGINSISQLVILKIAWNKVVSRAVPLGS